MENLDRILQDATAAVEDNYFRLHIDGADAPIYRERVYCYELYHQMRCRWPAPDNCPFYLNGEVDKRAHPILSKLGLGGIPDFLVHGPGDMGRNHAIIEVKSSNVRNSGIAGDLRKLTLFSHGAGYKRAIYLIYGDEAGVQAERTIRIARRIPSLAKIELWIHHQVESPAQCVEVLMADELATAHRPMATIPLR
jgi:hypothetical protein